MQHKVIDTKDVVIRFAGDSGDGMQLTGSLFADMSAIFGNELSTFPDYPAEIRAPQGTVWVFPDSRYTSAASISPLLVTSATFSWQ